MKVQDSIFQLDATTPRVAGIGLWAYDTAARKLWYSSFADNVHITSEPFCVDIDSYFAIVTDDDQENVIEYMLSMQTPPLSNLRYRIHGNGEDFYLDNRVVSSTPTGGGFLVRSYVQDITRQVLLEFELPMPAAKPNTPKSLNRLSLPILATNSAHPSVPLPAFCRSSSIVTTRLKKRGTSPSWKRIAPDCCD